MPCMGPSEAALQVVHAVRKTYTISCSQLLNKRPHSQRNVNYNILLERMRSWQNYHETFSLTFMSGSKKAQHVESEIRGTEVQMKKMSTSLQLSRHRKNLPFEAGLWGLPLTHLGWEPGKTCLWAFRSAPVTPCRQPVTQEPMRGNLNHWNSTTI